MEDRQHGAVAGRVQDYSVVKRQFDRQLPDLKAI
jgi:hypothetical protein